jgi:hypothetical protein
METITRQDRYVQCSDLCILDTSRTAMPFNTGGTHFVFTSTCVYCRMRLLLLLLLLGSVIIFLLSTACLS